VAAARKSAVGKQLALAMTPGLAADKPMPQLATGKFMVVGKDCKEKEAAALFITEQVSPEAQLINAKVAAEPPSRRSVIKDAWFNTPEGADMKFMPKIDEYWNFYSWFLLGLRRSCHPVA